MNQFYKMYANGNVYTINRKKTFYALGTFKDTTVERVFQFACDMTFSDKGEHRDHRSGGFHKRKKGEIFANTFQGKLAECAVYNQLFGKVEISEPDFETYGLGRWDSADFLINGHKVSIKSTKAFGNLLLLETRDWDSEGRYLPNNEAYDFTFLVRMKPYCEDVLRQARMLYSDFVDLNELRNIICSKNWEYDIPGFVALEELQHIIRNQFIIPQGAMLNGKTRIDAENYYVQSGDMHNLSEFEGKFNE